MYPRISYLVKLCVNFTNGAKLYSIWITIYIMKPIIYIKTYNNKKKIVSRIQRMFLLIYKTLCIKYRVQGYPNPNV